MLIPETEMQSQYNPTDKKEPKQEGNDSTKQVSLLLGQQAAPQPAVNAEASPLNIAAYPSRFRNWALVPGNESKYTAPARLVFTASHYDEDEDHESLSYVCSNRRSGPRG
jgi:hypothetical protein